LSADRVRVELGERSYDVLIGPGLLRRAVDEIAAVLPQRKLAVITDSNVAELHLPALRTALQERGLLATEIVVPAGEKSKSFNELQRVVEGVLQARLERGDGVVALGGGVVGDLAGFTAAVVRRGVSLVQVPTTLLAQVDSSVGGKTGINARAGKNLVGAFHQPVLVLADTDLLDTLSKREFAAGYAEVAKYGLLGDLEFFAWLERNRAEVFDGGEARTHAIVECVRAKARIVAADERETSGRALLNLGHTFGHALEAACDYDAKRLVHGEAIAIGMVLAHDFSAAEGLAPAADAERVRVHLREAGLPTRIADIPGPALSSERLMRHIVQDKKVKSGRLTFILTRGIGKAFEAEDVPAEQVAGFLEGQLGENQRPARA
jgi:3-dehydroquinate synthase